jgi:hypothetical protein
MADTSATQGVRALLITVLIAGAATMIISKMAIDNDTVWPSPSASATASVKPSPSPKASATGAIEEWPDCGYALPTCVRQEGETWYVIGDYEGDKHPVTLIRSEVRGSVLYRFVRAS